MRIITRSEKGNVRNNNEDYCSYVEVGPYKILAIADGIGGIEGGEIASRIAVETVIENAVNDFADLDMPDTISEIFDSYYQTANKRILKEALLNTKLNGMGATLTIAAITGNKVYVSHLGDTRAYLVHGNSITKLTKDHSIDGKLVKSLGVNEFIEPDNYCYNVIYGDLLLLCSDGIHGVMSDHEILTCVKKHNNLEGCISNLFDKAYENESRDNLTAMILHIKPN